MARSDCYLRLLSYLDMSSIAAKERTTRLMRRGMRQATQLLNTMHGSVALFEGADEVAAWSRRMQWVRLVVRQREAARGKQSGRTVEIQRLIGRSLRAALNLKLLGERTLIVDCDVIQADGGTRTAAISGACVAVVDALNGLQRSGDLDSDPLRHLISAVSVGVWKGLPVVDLDYAEDSRADSDMNVVMTEHGGLIEVQGTAEGATFTQEELTGLLTLASSASAAITTAQRAALSVG